MAYGDAMGLPALREALASHLHTFRSVSASADQIMIVSGSQQALALSARALLAPGDAAWLEEPGYPGARDALLVADARIVPVPVDEDGLDVAAGIARAEGARVAYVTPSHQYPLGVVMSASRRLAILDWARRRGSWLIEDDYDSEYRYDGPPLTSLQGLDRDARVLYVGTFSKILFPALRVGYLVIPRDLVDRFQRLRNAMDIFPAPLLQAVLADLIGEGHFARHLRRMRALYAERRRALVAALDRELGDVAHVIGDHAGMHLVALLPEGADDQSIALRSMRRGISAAPLSSCYFGPVVRQGLVLGFGSARPGQMLEAVRRLRAAIAGDSDGTGLRGGVVSLPTKQGHGAATSPAYDAVEPCPRASCVTHRRLTDFRAWPTSRTAVGRSRWIEVGDSGPRRTPAALWRSYRARVRASRSSLAEGAFL
jgi:GntR family transcriptional regulator / MocR family aminotransferase